MCWPGRSAGGFWCLRSPGDPGYQAATADRPRGLLSAGVSPTQDHIPVGLHQARTALTFADFALTQPRVLSVLSIEDHIRLEVDLTLREAS